MTNDKPKRVDAMFAFLVVDPTDGNEGVPAFYSHIHNAHLPLMGADIERANSMQEVVQTIATQMGTRIELVRFAEREHLGWVEP